MFLNIAMGGNIKLKKNCQQQVRATRLWTNFQGQDLKNDVIIFTIQNITFLFQGIIFLDCFFCRRHR